MEKSKSRQVKCDICGKTFAARGIKSHMRLMHHLKVTEQVSEIVHRVFEPVQIDLGTKVNSSGDLGKSSQDLSKLEENSSKALFERWYVRDGDNSEKSFDNPTKAINQVKKNINDYKTLHSKHNGNFIGILLDAKGSRLDIPSGEPTVNDVMDFVKLLNKRKGK